MDVVPRLDVLHAAVDRVTDRPELEGHGDALAARLAANAGKPLPEKRWIVERAEHVRDTEVPTVFVDRDEERVEESVGRVDVVATELVERVTGRRIDAGDIHAAILIQGEGLLQCSRVAAHRGRERGDADTLLSHSVVGRTEALEVEPFHEE